MMQSQEQSEYLIGENANKDTKVSVKQILVL
jgi:hypothetical protein